MLKFEWDPNKSAINKKKHGVSFEEAQTVFFDPNARVIEDPEHSDQEERFVIMGVSQRLRILTVCYCYRRGNKVIRIISARRSDKKEKKIYKEFLL
ncbi:MAG: BrnT family toxin [Pseudomonadota bacterium]